MRWKPKKDENVWITNGTGLIGVTSYPKWASKKWIMRRVDAGRGFRTKAEAQQALKRVKAALKAKP